MKALKYLMISICMLFLLSGVANANNVKQHSFNSYDLFEQSEVMEFLNNPSIEWLDMNSQRIRTFEWEEDKDTFTICSHPEINYTKYSFNDGAYAWYTTSTWNGYYSRIYSEDNFLQWSNIDYINEWIKELGFDKEFDEYAIINTPELYPNMIYLKAKDETYILALNFVKEQELIDKEISSIDDIKIIEQEQYEMYKLDEFVKKYENGYQETKVDLSYISVNGKDIDKDYAIMYVPNEDDGYIEINDLKEIFDDELLDISIKDNNINIYREPKKSIHHESRKMPISTYFISEKYNVYYRGKEYTVFGYGLNDNCYLNINDVSKIFNVDIGLQQSKFIYTNK